MTPRSLSSKTRHLMKEWYLGNLSPQDETQLIGSLIGEMSQTKQKQVDKIEKDYYRG